MKFYGHSQTKHKHNTSTATRPLTLASVKASADDFASPGAYVPGGGGGMSVPDVSYDDDDDGDIIE